MCRWDAPTSPEGASRCYCEANLNNLDLLWSMSKILKDWSKAHVKAIFKKETRRTQGTTGPSVSSQFLERWKLILETIKYEKIIRSSQHGLTKRKPCLTNLINFSRKWLSWWVRGEQWLLSTWNSGRLLTIMAQRGSYQCAKIPEVKVQRGWSQVFFQ